MRGRVFAYLGRCEEAREALERARELATTTTNPRGHNFGNLEAQVQTVVYGCPADYDSSAVVESARRFAESEPGNPATWQFLGAALDHDGLHEEARDALLRAVELVGKAKVGDLLLLSMTSFQLGDRTDARSYCDQAVAEMGPDSRNPFLINYHRDASRLLGLQ